MSVNLAVDDIALVADDNEFVFKSDGGRKRSGNSSGKETSKSDYEESREKTINAINSFHPSEQGLMDASILQIELDDEPTVVEELGKID